MFLSKTKHLAMALALVATLLFQAAPAMATGTLEGFSLFGNDAEYVTGELTGVSLSFDYLYYSVPYLVFNGHVITQDSSSPDFLNISILDPSNNSWVQFKSISFTGINLSSPLTVDLDMSAFGVSSYKLKFSLADLGDPSTPFVSLGNFTEVQAVPAPAAAWLLGTGLLGMLGVRRSHTA